MRPTSHRLAAALGTVALLTVAGCGSDEASTGSASAASSPGTSGAVAMPVAKDGKVTVQNCGQPVTFPSPAKRMFVNDGNMISMALADGAAENVVAVSSEQRDKPVLARHYGAAVVDGLTSVSKEYPSKGTVVAQNPDVFFAGWNYGFDETSGLTPAGLATKGIATYTLTESCRQGKGKERGIVDPWTALRTDLTNIGAITGHADEATKVVGDLDARLAKLQAAPKATTPPTIFLFDSGSKTIYSSGKFGAPQAIIEAAGGRNAMAGVQDTWTEVSWEQLVQSKPDAFLFVDYPPQTFAQKVALLKDRAGVKDLPAVKEGRFLNLPYALWTSGPLNIDAAEQARKQLESWGLVPASNVQPAFDDVVDR